MNVEKVFQQAHKEFRAKKFVAALKNLEKIQRVAPRYKNAYHLEAAIWNARKNVVREYQALEKMLPLIDTTSPKEKEFAVDIFIKIAEVCKNLALVERSCKYYYLVGIMSDDKNIVCGALDAVLLVANCSELFSAADFHAIYEEYEKVFKNITPYPKKFYDHRKIRVGYLSADFRNHAAIFWSWTLITKLDRRAFDIYCYSNTQEEDFVTEQLRKGFVIWRDIRKMTDAEAAQLIRDDEIDILFDLGGHTSDSRFPVLAYHSASVQMSGVGYMNSTGLDCFDFFLSDIYCTGNVEATSEFFNEKVLRLPHTHIRYSPSNKLAPAAEPPCLKNGYVTFGTFNQYRKITDSMLIAWKTILDLVPNSRLFLKTAIFNDKDGRNFVSERLKSVGIDPKRVEMRGFSANHLAEYGDMDIALDTFPYTGGVTTCEALYMGVPVVSLYGDRPGSRFGLSLLKNVGLDELAVDSYEDYVKRAVALANDWDLIAMLRRNLRTMMEQSPLMDTPGYTLAVQQAFISILDYERKKHESTEGSTDNGH